MGPVVQVRRVAAAVGVAAQDVVGVGVLLVRPVIQRLRVGPRHIVRVDPADLRAELDLVHIDAAVGQQAVVAHDAQQVPLLGELPDPEAVRLRKEVHRGADIDLRLLQNVGLVVRYIAAVQIAEPPVTEDVVVFRPVFGDKGLPALQPDVGPAAQAVHLCQGLVVEGDGQVAVLRDGIDIDGLAPAALLRREGARAGGRLFVRGPQAVEVQEQRAGKTQQQKKRQRDEHPLPYLQAADADGRLFGSGHGSAPLMGGRVSWFYLIKISQSGKKCNPGPKGRVFSRKHGGFPQKSSIIFSAYWKNSAYNPAFFVL